MGPSKQESKRLLGRVAVVAGATRGAGRGIARMLGEAGATVYCTGRSSRARQRSSGVTVRPETVEETAELVDAPGGTGIAVCVDHAAEDQVAALFERVRREQNRLDVLAVAMTGHAASWKNFMDDNPADGMAFLESWIRPHIVTMWHGAKLMSSRRSGLIVDLVEQDNIGYHGAFYFDLMETMLKRLAFSLANDLGNHGVTTIAVGPGFMRTEAILDGYGVREANWKDALTNPQAAAMGWAGSESPCFVGRAIAALAADPHVARKNGGVYTARALSEEYGFTDIDGVCPDFSALDQAMEQAKKTFLAPMMEAAGQMGVEWKMIPKAT